ncbi:MAG: amino acid ABC transporter permease [Alphaproteobacteria bacterium]|nr:amino acid ABC transporter permease [Alphaproteobacteria bacterium]
MKFDVGLILSWIPAALAGLEITIAVWLAGGLCALALGFGVAAARRFGGALVDRALTLYVALIRDTPFLIQLFLLYYGGPFVGLELEPYQAGLIGLTVYGSAYFAEIIRAGFEAVPVGHQEAAICAGLTRAQMVRRILLPEMALLVLPPVVNMQILLLKETAVLSIVTVPELTMTLTSLGSEHFAFAEALSLLAGLYWVLVEVTGALGRFAERRLARLSFAA